MTPDLFGLDAFALAPPWALLASISLLLGIAVVNALVMQFLVKKAYLLPGSLPTCIFLGPILGAAIFGPFLYSYLLFGTNTTLGIAYLAYLLAAVGITYIIYILLFRLYSGGKFTLSQALQCYKLLAPSISWAPVLLCLLLIAMALMSLAPPTDADELDYHLGVPLAILNSGSWLFAPEWFHSRLAGMGEAFIALGLAIGAESFGSFFQFAGLIALVFILLRAKQNSDKPGTSLTYALIFCCSPVLLWLVSTSKPLLVPMAMTTLALALLPQRTDSSSTAKVVLTHFTLACFLLLSAAQMKFNFLLSGFLAGLIWLFVMYRARLLWQALCIGILLTCLIVVPPAIWKSIHFGGDWFAGIITLFPGQWAGYPQFESMLRHYQDSSLSFPLSVFFSTVPGQITTIIGIGAIIWIVGLAWILRNAFRTSTILSSAGLISLASAGLVVVGSLLGQTGGRFYLEPLAWLLLALCLYEGKSPQFLRNRWVLGAIYAQTVFTLIGALFCAFLLFPGSLSSDLRSAVLDQNAYQYAEMHWLESALPISAVVLLEARSKALSPRKAISLDWASFVNPKSPEAQPYLEQIKKYQVTHLLSKVDPKNSLWSGCLKKTLAGPFMSTIATRNPFNRGQANPVWVVEFDSGSLPQCLYE